MQSNASPLNGPTNDSDLGPMPPAQEGMEIDSSSSPRPSEERRPSDASILAVPSRLQIIMEGLTEVIRHTLGPDHHYSTSEIDAPIDHGLLRGVLMELRAQDMKLPEDVGVVISAIQSYLTNGAIDHTNPLVENIVKLAASIPEESKGGNVIAGALIKNLWETVDHPPLTRLGTHYKYRAADGSNNSVTYPNLGKAGSAYARSVTPRTVLPPVLPDPSIIFDALFARNGPAKEHPSGISSMLFYFHTIIMHDVFRTDVNDYTQVDSSSYLDLGPLYGHNEEQQAAVRTFVDGRLKPDAFSDVRVLGFPPGVCALLVSFNRFHNFVVGELAIINEGGRFSLPAASAQRAFYEAAMKQRDGNLFQTGRLITCGLYVHIILGDYLKTILNLNRCNSTWNLDPLADLGNVKVPSATGNQVSVEFNLTYRWHTAMSAKDESWAQEFYKNIFPFDDLETLSLPAFEEGLLRWEFGVDADPGKRTFGELRRRVDGSFEDAELVNVLKESTEAISGAFGACNVPAIMKIEEILSMQQARSWRVCTLNELREFFQLTPHEAFTDINPDPDVAAALEALYGTIDLVELYPGIIAEQAALPDTVGQGLCAGSTISKAILLNTVALVRGDRYYTVDYTPGSLTNWGYKQASSDPHVAGGGVMYKLLMRAYPDFYEFNSTFAMFPFTIPKETWEILETLEINRRYYEFRPPFFIDPPIHIKSWIGVTEVLDDEMRFIIPWGSRIWALTGHDHMLSHDTVASGQQKMSVYSALYGPREGLDEVRQFYETLTMQLVRQNSAKLGKSYHVDAVGVVGNASHANFIAYLHGIPLLDSSHGNGPYTDLELYEMLALVYAYVFADLDRPNSFALRGAAAKAAKELGFVLESICWRVISEISGAESAEAMAGKGPAKDCLRNYGTDLILRLAKRGMTADMIAWTTIPTAAAAVVTQAQGFAQVLNFYLSEPYNSHWPTIQKLAATDTSRAFRELEHYALESFRLNPPVPRLTRLPLSDTTIREYERLVQVRRRDRVIVDLETAGLDPEYFPDPQVINIGRPFDKHISHGFGAHACIGRRISVTAMAAQLRVFAQLKNLRRVPGEAGQLKSKTVDGNKVFMKQDGSDWWPFPATMKVQWDGFESWSPFAKGNVLLTKYPTSVDQMQ